MPVRSFRPTPRPSPASQRQPDPSIWDQSRPWDGMAELADAIAAVADADLSDLRAAAEERYWIGAVRLALAEAEAGIRDLETATDVARSLRLASRRLPCHDRRAGERGAGLHRRRGRGGHPIDDAPAER